MVEELAKQTVLAIWDEAKAAPSPKEQKAIAMWAIESQGVARIAASVKLAISDRVVAARVEEFDRDPWLLTVGNGTINLQTGAAVDFGWGTSSPR